MHRLNRTEYTNAIRDLLGLEIDGRAVLSTDDSDQEGFDNVASVLTVSPALLENYLSAARMISRLAVGDTTRRPVVDVFKVERDFVQDERMSEDLPFGSRGGIAVATSSRLTANISSSSSSNVSFTTTSSAWASRIRSTSGSTARC